MLEVLPGVQMMRRTWGSNIYLLYGERGPVMVDAGFPLDFRRLARALESSGGPMPCLMVATHYHLDHTGTMARLKKSYGCSVAAHRGDALVMEGTEPYDTFKLEPLKAAYYKLLSPLFRFEYVDVDVVLEEGDMVDGLGGLEVIHVPGHTRGSIALFQREQGILFSGDTIRNERGVLEGPPPRFTPSPRLSMRGIREKLLQLEFDVLLPGHGEPLLGGACREVASMGDLKVGGE